MPYPAQTDRATIVATARPFATEVALAVPASSFAEYTHAPSGVTPNCSGSLPTG